MRKKTLRQEEQPGWRRAKRSLADCDVEGSRPMAFVTDLSEASRRTIQGACTVVNSPTDHRYSPRRLQQGFSLSPLVFLRHNPRARGGSQFGLWREGGCGGGKIGEWRGGGRARG